VPQGWGGWSRICQRSSRTLVHDSVKGAVREGQGAHVHHCPAHLRQVCVPLRAASRQRHGGPLAPPGQGRPPVPSCGPRRQSSRCCRHRGAQHHAGAHSARTCRSQGPGSGPSAAAAVLTRRKHVSAVGPQTRQQAKRTKVPSTWAYVSYVDSHSYASSSRKRASQYARVANTPLSAGSIQRPGTQRSCRRGHSSPRRRWRACACRTRASLWWRHCLARRWS
jgi:hypothetical protein